MKGKDIRLGAFLPEDAGRVITKMPLLPFYI